MTLLQDIEIYQLGRVTLQARFVSGVLPQHSIDSLCVKIGSLV